MKDFWKNILKNLSYLFSVLGILLTIYFSVFYVPDYIKDYQNEKIKNINQELIETIQELVYNNEELNINDVKTLIKGKEIKDNITYPYSLDELLIQSQEAFMDNKFIPLKERKKLLLSIDSLRAKIKTEIKPTNQVQKTEIKSNWTNFLSVLVGISGVLISILGGFSVYLKSKKEKKEEIENAVETRKEQIEDTIKYNLNFNELVKEILKELNYDFHIAEPSVGTDFILRLNNNKSVFINVKFSRSERPAWGRSVYDKFIEIVKANNGFGLIIINYPDKYSRIVIEKYNMSNPNNPIEFVIGSEKEELKKNIQDKLKTFANNGS